MTRIQKSRGTHTHSVPERVGSDNVIRLVLYRYTCWERERVTVEFALSDERIHVCEMNNSLLSSSGRGVPEGDCGGRIVRFYFMKRNQFSLDPKVHLTSNTTTKTKHFLTVWILRCLFLELNTQSSNITEQRFLKLSDNQTSGNRVRTELTNYLAKHCTFVWSLEKKTVFL